METKKPKNNIILILIFLLAFVLRFYQLGKQPVSLDWDEASLGYNAYSILKTLRDEYGTFLPLEFRSFGDFKPPFYFYISTLTIFLFGLSEFAVRLPSCIFGTTTVIITYLLIKILFPKSKKIATLTAFLLSISPWHLQFSRVAFEANVGLFWFVLGVYLFIKMKDKPRYLLLSLLSFVLGFYTYHSLRLVVPFFVLGLAILLRQIILKEKKLVLISVIVTIFLLLPLVFNLAEGTKARFSSVTSIKPESLTLSIKQIEFDIERGDLLGRLVHNRRIVYFLGIVKGYLDHFDFSFLFLTGDGIGRHHVPGMGMLYLIELPFVLIGIYRLIFAFQDFFSKRVIFWWFLTAPLASSLTTGTPHPVRALLYLPTYQVFTACGIKTMIDWLERKNIFNKIILFFVFFFMVNMVYYLDMYYLHGKFEQAEAWQYGYKELVSEVKQIKSDSDQIIITYKYDQPYIYFLFYEGIDPSWYQKYWDGKKIEIKRFERSFGNLIFRNIDWEKDKNLTKTLLVGTPGEIPSSAAGLIKEIYFPNGEVAFRIVKN